ncbi:unnamed protein product [Rodentolepis nana]|uniref:Guanylate kinase-like domain-containing protein n=1 Tax=Rodentolepis nana TaxID=102285 RepID=A0A0R3THA2_RODNA|nr:unnamed protein product [Rodentolepis nana]
MSMERGKHPVLNLRPGAIEALIFNGIVPIVILITAKSAQQIRTVMEMYQRRCPRGGSSIRDVSRRLWAEIADLRATIAHLITDSVLLSTSSDEKFDETEWMHNLISIIRHHQSQPVSSKWFYGTTAKIRIKYVGKKITHTIASSQWNI